MLLPVNVLESIYLFLLHSTHLIIIVCKKAALSNLLDRHFKKRSEYLCNGVFVCIVNKKYLDYNITHVTQSLYNDEIRKGKCLCLSLSL